MKTKKKEPTAHVKKGERLKWQFSKGAGVAPRRFSGAKKLVAKPTPGGADLVVQKFTNAGDAPAATTVNDGGGKKLRNAVINLIFWGDAWNSKPPPNPSLGQVVNDVASILSGPYQLRVSQYGASSARLGTVFISVPGNNPPTNYTTANVQSLITSAIEGGALPEPDEENTDFLHRVFMPPLARMRRRTLVACTHMRAIRIMTFHSTLTSMTDHTWRGWLSATARSSRRCFLTNLWRR